MTTRSHYDSVEQRLYGGVRAYQPGKPAMRASKVAEMKAEIEALGYEFHETSQSSWYCLMLKEPLMVAPCRNLHDCVIAAFHKLYDETGQQRKLPKAAVHL